MLCLVVRLFNMYLAHVSETYHVPKSVLDIVEHENDFNEAPELKKPHVRVYPDTSHMIGCLHIAS